MFHIRSWFGWDTTQGPSFLSIDDDTGYIGSCTEMTYWATYENEASECF